MRIAALSIAAAALLLIAAGTPDDADPRLAGRWGVVFLRKELVRVPVLRDRPTVSLAGPGMVTRRGPLFSTVLRDEEVPMEVDYAVSLQVDAGGRFKLLTDKRRAASPTNDCILRSGARREGAVRQGASGWVLESDIGIERSVDCDGKVEGADRREGARGDVYRARLDGSTLIVTTADGEIWRLQKG